MISQRLIVLLAINWLFSLAAFAQNGVFSDGFEPPLTAVISTGESQPLDAVELTLPGGVGDDAYFVVNAAGSEFTGFALIWRDRRSALQPFRVTPLPPANGAFRAALDELTQMIAAAAQRRIDRNRTQGTLPSLAFNSAKVLSFSSLMPASS